MIRRWMATSRHGRDKCRRVLERKKKDGEVNSPLHAASEEGGAHADFGRTFFDGDFEVVGHAHG